VSAPYPARSGGRPLPTAAETVRSPEWAAALLALVGVLTFMYAKLFGYYFEQWQKPDYSHGFLVPAFAAYLAWHRRAAAPDRFRWPEPWGLAFVAGGAALFVVADKLNLGREWLQGLSLVINLCGAALLVGGWGVLRWLAAPLLFLVFMFPLPYRVEHMLGLYLQRGAAMASEFVLQTVGYPTYREGVILHVKEHVLEVEKACSGLSMLLTFLALATGMALLMRRPLFDRALILVSAVPVAVLSNVIRIALTGVLYNEAGKELGDRVFHDFAGWLMMPIALALLWGELKLLDWVWVDTGGPASSEEMVQQSAGPAYLFMTALPPAKGGTAPPKPGAAPAPGAPKGASR
jgi:exosortase